MSRVMDFIELDHEIIITRDVIDELKESGDYGALDLALSDYYYLISQLNK